MAYQDQLTEASRRKFRRIVERILAETGDEELAKRVAMSKTKPSPHSRGGSM